MRLARRGVLETRNYSDSVEYGGVGYLDVALGENKIR